MKPITEYLDDNGQLAYEFEANYSDGDYILLGGQYWHKATYENNVKAMESQWAWGKDND